MWLYDRIGKYQNNKLGFIEKDRTYEMPKENIDISVYDREYSECQKKMK